MSQPSTSLKYIPVLCTEIRPNGKVCGGIYRSDVSDNFYCVECGIQYAGPATKNVLEEDEDSESFYDSLDRDALESGDYDYINSMSGVSSLYQGEEEIGGESPVEISIIEQRLTRNEAAFHLCISEKSADEHHAKLLLHKKTVATEKAKKVAARQKHHLERLYDGKVNLAKKNTRTAAILFWVKESGPILTKDLYKLLEEHNIYLGDTKQLSRILDELVEKGRVQVEKQKDKNGNESRKMPSLVTFIR